MADLVVIFSTQSDVEASIVRGLLEAHGVPSIVSSPATHALFPLNVNELGEVRISVHAGDAEEARRIIDSHRTELTSGQWSACATSSSRFSATSTTASAIAGCSNTR